MKCKCGKKMSVVNSIHSTLAKLDHPEMGTTKRQHKCKNCGIIAHSYELSSYDLLAIVSSERNLNALKSILSNSVRGGGEG